MHVCLVTEELAGIGLSGGIGAAFAELASLLARKGAAVDILYCPITPLDESARSAAVALMELQGISLLFLDTERVFWGEASPEKRSYAVYRHLKESRNEYDVIHFHDYKGLGFFTQSAKDQGIAFKHAQIVVQLHGPTRWTFEANYTLPIHQDHLRIEFLERQSIKRADAIISPSQYLIDWLVEHEFDLPRRVHVIKNVCSGLVGRLREISFFNRDASPDGTNRLDEIVFFGRHEERKGFAVFCDALDRLNPSLSEAGVQVTFLGRFGSINGEPSGIVLANRAKLWRFPLAVIPNLGRDQAAEYLIRKNSALVVIPSRVENSPYTVLEAIALGKPVVTSVDGGARELIAEKSRAQSLCKMTPRDLAAQIHSALVSKPYSTEMAESHSEIEDKWLLFHKELATSASMRDFPASPKELPSVTLGITHFERPEKLLDAVTSAFRQTYKNLEIIVVDDGSTAPSTVAALEKIEVIVDRFGGKIIRQDNRYLGAARNSIARESKSDFLCFLDDDDIAFPHMIETLVMSALHSEADVTNCLNLFMEESRRHEAWPSPTEFRQKISYIPTGGPLSLVPLENCLGAATALIRRSAFEKVGGYSELRDVGHEDYEFFARILQAGFKIEICPTPLYLYEVDRPSMVSRTSVLSNFRRVVDALEFSKNSSEWRAFSELCSGRAARENMINRQQWLRSRDPLKSLIDSIETDTSLDSLLSKLAEYATIIGSPAAIAAFGRTQRDDYPSAEKLFPPSISCTKASYPHLQLRLALEAEEYEAAADQFAKQMTSGFLRDKDWALLQRLAAKLTSKGHISQLLEAAESVSVRDDLKKIIHPALFVLALKVNDRRKMQFIHENALSAEEREYLDRYTDVADAVSKGTLPNGLHHFEHWGKSEMRSGFQVLYAICTLAHEHLGKTIEPSDLKRIIARAS